ncbi:MAG: two-component system histidine kinase PnpS [Pirellulales bacterium]
MPRRRLLWHLLPSYAAIVLAAVIGIGWMTLRQIEQSWMRATRGDLDGLARFLEQHLASDLPGADGEFATLCRQLQSAGGPRISLLLPNGSVRIDSQNQPDELTNQLDRPEIQAAAAGETGAQVRYSPALDEHVYFLAVPVQRDRRVAAVLYLAGPMSGLEAARARAQLYLLTAGLVIAALAALLAWRAARTVTTQLGHVGQTADRLASGQWGARAALPDAQELADLAERFNRMADHLQRQIGVLTQNNNEQKAVLASMAEGVLAVDSQERVISMNTASRRLLGVDQTQAQGRALGEVVRNADLSRFISRALACRDPIEDDLFLLGDRQRVMQAHGSALHDSEGRAIGAVVVLNDVTDFRRLEDIRRDFVANVSHELKTPITSIKGFVETLLDGAMTDPVDSERFLRIIGKQADRLHAIIEDLLSLSKIEQSEEAEDIVLEPFQLRSALESAVNTCQSAAHEREIPVTLACDSGLVANINPMLFEQAVVNLLDNAIKYSDPGREVRISAEQSGQEVLIHVTDRGSGIADEHLPRIFERFYRVDRARSRKLGGTGLGLAIVKHIVLAHRGRVSVDSTLGVGSTFTIHLPKA